MSFQLLVQFPVKPDQVDGFLQLLQGAKSRIAAAEGCEGVEVLHSTENPGKVVLSEIWQSKELHDAYAEKMRASGSMNAMAEFLAGAPESEFFEIS
ncbi:putative quinol monooxygenase [Ketobacter sp.]|uniref:putative quinol monooxygenase n=1 Tax=Ketobacter sp. TaxID=2083498 RepID=UPI000F1B10DD|nr:antibiotic biosynthesis monooxygenase family protein [Ketobacter sp.]MEE2733576.1 antibiotic biosynthesis monooxygenase family protein [Pseudomonadota bacterium]RLT96959.1 MAG: hypothetical protein D9N14_13120 [Ketobacter sp.]